MVHANTGPIHWSAFSDVTETVPELARPNSITTYSAMRTDAQIASLLLAFTLPIRRYRWYIGPNGAPDEVVEDLANDFNLPIEGPRSQADNQTWRFVQSRPAEEASPTPYTPKKRDWYLKIKTKDKQCFGSAGCNVEVRVTPLYGRPRSA